MAGMPSLGGPPDMISSNETADWEKSVAPHSASQCDGASRAIAGWRESAATSARAGSVNAERNRHRM